MENDIYFVFYRLLLIKPSFITYYAYDDLYYVNMRYGNLFVLYLYLMDPS